MRLRHKVCEHEWEYKGKNPYKAPCPKCGGSVRINTSTVLDESK